MTADELQVILAYVEGRIAEAKQLLEAPLPDGMHAYWWHWLKQYQWWQGKLAEALAALQQQAGE